MRRVTSIGEFLFAALATACTEELPPRAQLVVAIDTDVPIPRFGDTLRIEILDAAGEATDRRVLVLPDPSSWPASFGVAPSAEPLRLRVRLYPSARIAAETPSAIALELLPDEPLPAFAIDRLLELGPARAVEEIRVTLRGSCLGRPADVGERRTCVDGADGAPTEGLERGSGVTERGTAAGSWVGALGADCVGQPRSAPGAEEVCIRGGAFFHGDERLGTNADIGAEWAAIPERRVTLSPFYMDVHEVTVARFRDAQASGFAAPAGSYARSARAGEVELCHYGAADRSLPMNCVTWRAAAAFCAWDGGRVLPSEAQWEFVASGEGAEWMYPWGDALPTCEHAIFSRVGARFGGVFFGGPVSDEIGMIGECGATEGASAVGVAAGDASPSGVRDLAGNVQEWVADSFQALTHPCFAGVSDPVCEVPEERSDGVSPRHGLRGGSWAGPPAQLAASFRSSFGLDERAMPRGMSFSGHAMGFRCARAARGP